MNNDLIRLRSEGCTHVINSEDSIRIAVARRLRRAGYQVRRYASIGEFLVRDTGGEFGCILTEVSFGEGPDGFALLQALSRSPDSLPVVFMSRSHNVASAVRAMKFGAIDYLNKPLKSGLLFNALDSALNLHKQRLSAVDPSSPILTEREKAVLRGVVAGSSNREIAGQLGLSERTIKNSRSGLMRRFSANSVADLLLRAAPLWMLDGSAVGDRHGSGGPKCDAAAMHVATAVQNATRADTLQHGDREELPVAGH